MVYHFMGKGAYTLFSGQEALGTQKEAVDKMILHFVTAPLAWGDEQAA